MRAQQIANAQGRSCPDNSANLESKINGLEQEILGLSKQLIDPTSTFVGAGVQGICASANYLKDYKMISMDVLNYIFFGCALITICFPLFIFSRIPRLTIKLFFVSLTNGGRALDQQQPEVEADLKKLKKMLVVFALFTVATICTTATIKNRMNSDLKEACKQANDSSCM